MKLIMTLLVRNEDDLLTENIEYHLSQGVDFIIATNNRSVDGTEDILRKYEAQGVLHYLEEKENTHDQGKWVTRMARLAATDFAADWVINNDADEFWWPICHSDLKQAFSILPQRYNVVEASRKNFVFLDTHALNRSFYWSMVYREYESMNANGKPLQPKQAHIAHQNVIVADGNHSVAGLGKQYMKRNTIEIFHFPVRSRAQFTRKIRNGGAALERNKNLSIGIGSTWRKLYKELLSAGNLASYLNAQTFNYGKLQNHLGTGEIIEDTRLKDYFSNKSLDAM